MRWIVPWDISMHTISCHLFISLGFGPVCTSKDIHEVCSIFILCDREFCNECNAAKTSYKNFEFQILCGWSWWQIPTIKFSCELYLDVLCSSNIIPMILEWWHGSRSIEDPLEGFVLLCEQNFHLIPLERTSCTPCDGESKVFDATTCEFAASTHGFEIIEFFPHGLEIGEVLTY